jgi:hypothetical protein
MSASTHALRTAIHPDRETETGLARTAASAVRRPDRRDRTFEEKLGFLACCYPKNDKAGQPQRCSRQHGSVHQADPDRSDGRKEIERILGYREWAHGNQFVVLLAADIENAPETADKAGEDENDTKQFDNLGARPTLR